MKIIVITLLAFSVITQAGTPLPPLILKPGSEYADEARMFQGIPAIERAPNGRLWAAWYGGGVTEDKHNYILLVTSGDDGKTWQPVTIVVPHTGRGNPPSMLKLKDGRLALIYGYRAEPYGIRARLSADAGETWSDDIVLRAGAGNWDIGYPRSVQRPDGKVVTIYYYNDSKDSDRYIGATIWDPGKGSGTAR